MNEVLLAGLDGGNPLGFLAALGLLRVLEDVQPDPTARARLSWREDGAWRPVLHGPPDTDAVIDVVLGECRSWKDHPALALAYDGERAVKTTAKGAIRDLKPPPAVMRGFLEQLARLAASGERIAADTVAALGTELAVDNNGNVKPTALHFTAGQQTFLKAVAQLQESLSREDVEEALKGPWRGESKLPSLSWDSAVSRIYALRAGDPSKEKRGSVPGAEWLAFRGLSFFPVAPVSARSGPRVITTGVSGGWKDGVFTWPIWNRPASADSVRSLLTWARLSDAGAARSAEPEAAARLRREAAARGVATILQASITRSDQGGYGGFSPSRVF